MLEKGLATTEDLATWRRDLEEEIETITSRVLREPAPDPDEEEWNAYASAF
jgi:pyruvate dehydrogenase E1 component alpha subunit/2-oxoisovalerate dehydrogenase E1 component alpha subunit